MDCSKTSLLYQHWSIRPAAKKKIFTGAKISFQQLLIHWTHTYFKNWTTYLKVKTQIYIRKSTEIWKPVTSRKSQTAHQKVWATIQWIKYTKCYYFCLWQTSGRQTHIWRLWWNKCGVTVMSTTHLESTQYNFRPSIRLDEKHSRYWGNPNSSIQLATSLTDQWIQVGTSKSSSATGDAITTAWNSGQK